MAFTRAAGRPLVLAHRGGMGEAVASSLEAFDRAASLGVDGLEIDVHPTSDRRLVVFHDYRLDPATNMRGPVNGYSFRELEESLDLDPGGSRRVPPCTFDDVISRFGELLVSVDIKEDLGRGSWVEDGLARICGESAPRVVVASFFDPPIARMRRSHPEIHTAATAFEGLAWNLLHRIRCGAGHGYEVLSLPHRFLGAAYIGHDLVAAAHDEGLAVWVWTVNDAADLLELAEMGADAVITDLPGFALEVLGG